MKGDSFINEQWCNTIYSDRQIGIGNKWKHLASMEDSVSYSDKSKISRLNTGLTDVWGWIFFAVLQSTAGGAGGLWQPQFTLSLPRAAIYFETWLVWAVYCHQKEEEILNRIAEKSGVKARGDKAFTHDK